jgi:hypothetical protein
MRRPRAFNVGGRSRGDAHCARQRSCDNLRDCDNETTPAFRPQIRVDHAKLRFEGASLKALIPPFIVALMPRSDSPRHNRSPVINFYFNNRA